MKARRVKNGLTKAEFLQRDIDKEVVSRVEEALAKMVKKKKESKSKREEE